MSLFKKPIFGSSEFSSVIRYSDSMEALGDITKYRSKQVRRDIAATAINVITVNFQDGKIIEHDPFITSRVSAEFYNVKIIPVPISPYNQDQVVG